MKVTQTLFSGPVSNGATNANLISDAKQAILTLNADSAVTATIKFVVSFQRDLPDFSAAQSSGNDWHYVQVVDINDGSFIDGNVGVSVAATAIHKAYAMNLDGARYIGVIISGAGTGNIDIDVMLEDSLAS